MKVLIDNGHGEKTAGKRSPDGTLREYAYAREVAERVVNALRLRGIDAERLVPEKSDIDLKERVRRVNAHCLKHGAENVLLVSVHLNASGNGTSWGQGRGWQVCVGRNASSSSRRAASCLTEAAVGAGLKVRRYKPDQDWWAQNLFLMEKTRCPAVLTENLFMDNREDCALLMSEDGMDRIVRLHVEGIMAYIGV